jgi:hypothetical protein
LFNGQAPEPPAPVTSVIKSNQKKDTFSGKSFQFAQVKVKLNDLRINNLALLVDLNRSTGIYYLIINTRDDLLNRRFSWEPAGGLGLVFWGTKYNLSIFSRYVT